MLLIPRGFCIAAHPWMSLAKCFSFFFPKHSLKLHPQEGAAHVVHGYMERRMPMDCCSTFKLH